MDFSRNLWPTSIRMPHQLVSMLRISHLRFPLAMLCLVVALAQVPRAAAQLIEGFDITTDELFEDKRESRIIARGNVEIRYFGEILLADEVIYDRKLHRLWAQGNLQLQEADG
jgi:lipopolysaccharide assembly outer membrane protein LptD (OstA)